MWTSITLKQNWQKTQGYLGIPYVGLGPLLKYGLVIVSRKIGNTTLYKLNVYSPAVEAVDQINECIVEQIAKEELDGK